MKRVLKELTFSTMMRRSVNARKDTLVPIVDSVGYLVEKTEEAKPIQTVDVSFINNLPYLTFACDYLAFAGEMENYWIHSKYDLAALTRIPTIEICNIRCQNNKDCGAYTFDKANDQCVLKGAKELSKDTKVGIIT